MSETLIHQSEQESTPIINAEQAAVVAQTDQLEAEMSGAYSSLGNRHTYMVDAEGKNRVVKRADAVKKAEQLNEARQQLVNESEQIYDDISESVVQESSNDSQQAEAGLADELPEVATPESADEQLAKVDVKAEVKSTDSYDPSQRTVHELIKDWAAAEVDGDYDAARLAQDGLQESLIAASDAGDLKNEDTSILIDALDELKNQKKSSLLEKRAERDFSKESHRLRADLESEDQQEAPTLFDYDKEVTAPIADTPETAEMATIEDNNTGEESTASEERGFKARLLAVKNAILTIPAKLPSMMERARGMKLPEDNYTRIKLGLGITTVAAAGYYLANKGFGVDMPFIGGSGSRVDGSNIVPAEAIPQSGGGAGSEMAQSLASNTPESVGIDTSQLSWDVANQLSPGNEGGVIQSAIEEYNNVHGTNFALNPVNSWIMDGPRSISPAEMAELNSLMKA